MGYKQGSHPDDPAFPQGTGMEQGMTYYQWLVGQLVKNPKFIVYSLSLNGKAADEIAGNIIRVADKLIEKMENKEQ